MKPHDLFGPGSNVERRICRDFEELKRRVDACRELGLKIVLTSGTFDILHIGHSRYFEAAAQLGDVLIVGVDSDNKVRQRKGPHRPVVGEDERMEIVCHIRHVDLVALKTPEQERWALIKVVDPDVLVVTRDQYQEPDLTALREFCGLIQVLDPQATTSTTAKIRKMLIGPLAEVKSGLEALTQQLAEMMERL